MKNDKKLKLMNEKEAQKIYEFIKDLANKLCSVGKVYMRADIAYELRKYDINIDSIDISRLVYEAYKYYNNDKFIEKSFATNDNRNTLVSEYLLYNYINNGDNEVALNIIKNKLSDTEYVFNKIADDIQLNLVSFVAKNAEGIIDSISGTNIIKNIKNNASVLFEKYRDLIDSYHLGEDSIRMNINDFCNIRAEILSIYHKYANYLIDIYGDKIKKIEPNLFDFSKIEFIDVDSLLKETELKYNKLTDNCAILIDEISDNFKKSISRSMSTYRSIDQNNKALGLAIAGLEMINHYIDSAQRTNIIKSEFNSFKKSINQDALTIKADLARLVLIYKSLNDIAIPKAELYLRYSNKIIDKEINAIIASLYDDDNIKYLEEKRSKIRIEIRNIDNKINDHSNNIDIYNSQTKIIEDILQSKEASYNIAKNKKPSKPFFLINIFTLGYANKSFYRNYSEWDTVCYPLVREYESYLVEKKLSKDELKRHKEQLEVLIKEREALQIRINTISEEIRKKIISSKEVQTKMLPHLRSIISLMYLGREIMETKIDSKLVNTVKIDINSIKLPQDIDQKIDMFTNSISEISNIDNSFSKNILEETNLYIENTTNEYSEEDLSLLTNATNNTIQNSINLLNSTMKLQLEYTKGKIDEAFYKKEYDKIINDFRANLQDLDNKSDYLRTVMQQINKELEIDKQKDALLLLRELGEDIFSEKDFDDFIKGEKTINI